MKITTEPMENSQIALNVEMEDAEVAGYMDKAYNRLVKKVSVPGFRKGKTPRTILEQHIGKEVILQEALEDLIPETYEEALKGQEIDAIDRPKIEIVQTEPVIFKAIVPVKPTVNLGDYKQINFNSEPVEVNDEDVETVIEQLRHQHATLLPVDRPVQFDDTVIIDIEGKSQEESFPIRKDLVYEVVKDSKLPLPGFAEKLEGMTKEEERSFVLSYPTDYEIEELAGREHSFKVMVTDIKEKKLSEIDDELAVIMGSQDLASLREEIASNLKTRAEEKARLELEQKVVDAVVELSELKYPPILADREVDRMLNEEARHFTEGVSSLENYLKSIGKTMDAHVEELRPMADKQVVRALVLAETAKVESVEVNDSEIDDEIEKMAKDAGEQAEDVRKLFSLPQARESISQFLVTRKTVNRLVEIASNSE